LWFVQFDFYLVVAALMPPPAIPCQTRGSHRRLATADFSARRLRAGSPPRPILVFAFFCRSTVTAQRGGTPCHLLNSTGIFGRFSRLTAAESFSRHGSNPLPSFFFLHDSHLPVRVRSQFDHLIHRQSPWNLMRYEQHRDLPFQLVDRPRKVLRRLLIQIRDSFIKDQNLGTF
jgi:hypothetical protein